jgi:sugar phosphate permease
LGAIFGSIILGYISDKMYSKRSPVAMLAVLLSMMISYIITFHYLSMSLASFYICMFFFGFFESGLSNILSASCAADLGK